MDFLAEPAAHLRAGIAAHEIDDAVIAIERAQQVAAAALPRASFLESDKVCRNARAPGMPAIKPSI